MTQDPKKIIFSGIQPSGSLTLGNYLGAVKNWAKLQQEYLCYYCVVDMHAITVRQDPQELKKRCVEVMSLLIAAGLDPMENILFFQSHVSAHAELAWVLNCYAYIGELSRMTQFKEKSGKNEENINSGLFTYPVLMAADILLYGSHLVPVGADQKQHLELARDIALRFNNVYGEVFTVPEPYIPKVGAKVMSLTEPEKKMSKSDENSFGYIALLDPPDLIAKKIRRAVTDSENAVRYDENKPGVSNLLSIYGAVTGMRIEDAESVFEGKGYGAFKEAVAEAVLEELKPLQERYRKIRADREYLNAVIRGNAERAAGNAQKILRRVYKKIGLAPREI